ncbi:Homeodomain-like protein [Sporodiniella umbellata]|nr:Homeodomain-like protein [Sporodiniella umbellata]
MAKRKIKERPQLMSDQDLYEMEKYVQFEQGPSADTGFSQRYLMFDPYTNGSMDDEEEDGSEELFSTPIRPRKRFDSRQIGLLEKAYEMNDHPPRETKDRLAEQFKTSPRRIQIWFQNRRAKSKKKAVTTLTEEVSDGPDKDSTIYLSQDTTDGRLDSDPKRAKLTGPYPDLDGGSQRVKTNKHGHTLGYPKLDLSPSSSSLTFLNNASTYPDSQAQYPYHDLLRESSFSKFCLDPSLTTQKKEE